MGEQDKSVAQQWDLATQPGGETTVQRNPRVLVGYEPLADKPSEPDLTKPVYEDRPLPKVGDVIDRPNGRKATVLSAQVADGSQVLGIRYID